MTDLDAQYPSTEELLIQEISAIAGEQQRIDHVAKDFESGDHRYAGIAAITLGRLLGVDLLNSEEDGWHHSFYCHKMDLSDSGSSYPYADYLYLIKDVLPAKRYAKLEALADEITDGEDDIEKPDLPLTSKEISLLCEAYAQSSPEGPSDYTVARRSLFSSDGCVELEFEVCIGCGGSPENPCGPYDLDNGLGFDSSEWIQVD